MPDTVLLTGISGFLGGHVALALLRAGYAVRGSLRDMGRAEKMRTTLTRAGADISRLDFVALDLLSDAGWAQAMRGVRFLQHTASPFLLAAPADPQHLIAPAVEGTRRALTAALAAGVERIVLTSSIAAIQYGHADPGRLLDETDWTDPDSPGANAYARSKTLAEREAWALMAAAGRRADLAVLNPAVLFGPLLDDDPGTSALLVQRLLNNSLPALPPLHISCADVRDVAALHLAAMTDPAAGGQRCIVSQGTYSLADIAGMLRPAFPERRIPRRVLPLWLLRLAALFEGDLRANLAETGAPKRLDATRAPRRLGHPLIPTADAAIATGRSLLAHGLL